MRRRWSLGLIVGPLAVIALLVIPTLGLVLSVVVALLLLKARGLPALAGMLCGAGVSGLALLAQANARCETSYAGCQAEKVMDPVIIFAALLITGAALTLTQYVQARAGRASI